MKLEKELQADRNGDKEGIIFTEMIKKQKDAQVHLRNIDYQLIDWCYFVHGGEQNKNPCCCGINI